MFRHKYLNDHDYANMNKEERKLFEERAYELIMTKIKTFRELLNKYVWNDTYVLDRVEKTSIMYYSSPEHHPRGHMGNAYYDSLIMSPEFHEYYYPRIMNLYVEIQYLYRDFYAIKCLDNVTKYEKCDCEFVCEHYFNGIPQNQDPMLWNVFNIIKFYEAGKDGSVLLFHDKRISIDGNAMENFEVNYDK